MCLGAVCALCCSCGTCCKCSTTSTGSKFVYLLLVMLSAVLGLVLRYYGDEFVADFYAFEVGCTADRCVGIQGVYRISFATAVLFLGLTIGTKMAPTLHRGGWGLKFLIWAVLIVLSFLISNSFFRDAYSWISRVGSVLFLILQMLILLDLFFDLHDYLTTRAAQREEDLKAQGYETTGLCQNKWSLLYLLLSVGSLVTSLVFLGIFYDLFPCGRSKFHISFTLVWGVLIILVCLWPKVAKGLLPGAMLLGYNTFLLWGALTAEPKHSCNDYADQDSVGRVIVGILIAALSIAWSSTRAANSTYGLFFMGDNSKPMTVAGSGASAAAVPTSSSGTSDAEAQAKLDANLTGERPVTGTDHIVQGVAVSSPGAGAGAGAGSGSGAPKANGSARGGADGDEDSDDPSVDRSPMDQNAWVFHFVLFFASLYMAMLLTNWGSLTADSDPKGSPEVGRTSMWVRLASIWAINLLFTWILVAPLCCPNRTFHDPNNQFARS